MPTLAIARQGRPVSLTTPPLIRYYNRVGLIAGAAPCAAGPWGYSSTGRARRSQCRGCGFEPRYLHHSNPINPAPVAQWTERRRPKSRGGGSSPSRGTTTTRCPSVPGHFPSACLAGIGRRPRAPAFPMPYARRAPGRAMASGGPPPSVIRPGSSAAPWDDKASPPPI